MQNHPPHPTRREVLYAGAATAALIAAPFASPHAVAQESAPAPAPKPNLLIIGCSRQHWRAAGFADAFFTTPALDAFADEALVFERAFCTGPSAAPSRASILTGLMPHRAGVLANPGEAGFNPMLLSTVAAMLKAGGYRTAYFGQWGLGDDELAADGIDELKKDIDDDQITRDARDYLEKHKADGQPFALFLWYRGPAAIADFDATKDDRDAPPQDASNLPESWKKDSLADKPKPQKLFMAGPAEQGQADNDPPANADATPAALRRRALFNAERPAWERYRLAYRDAVNQYDTHVGKVIDALRAADLHDDTAVFITADTGEMDTHHRITGIGPFMYDQAVRVPLLVRLPEKLGGARPARLDSEVQLTDLVPTLLDLAALPAEATDGFSLKPALTGQGRVHPRPVVTAQYHATGPWVTPLRMVRHRDWKLTFYMGHGQELYHLAEDPHELENHAYDPLYSEITRQLLGVLQQMLQRTGDPFTRLKPTKMNGEPVEP